ncbi:MAG: tripartite tricarboxylate transporter substrate binding protein [Xanthobacteraceae bacterium]|nr:tripartite tricarboxylate transporter substrate binding protein [Xanthobacteraceae bacterium]
MNWTRRTAIAVAILGFWCGAIFTATGVANAQEWPSRPVKFIVPLGPGSGTDIGARLVAEQLTRLWNQAVVVENRIGGDGIVGINAFIAARDSHTLLYMPTSSFVAHPYQHEKLPYDPAELSPVARITNTYVGLVVSPSLNAATVGDLIAAARTQPGKLNYATGTGMTDVQFEAYFKREGLALTRVSYRDVVTPMTDLSEGRIQAYAAGLPIVQPHAQAGRARLVAVTNSRRSASNPDVPTVAEAGFPGLTFDGLVGIFGPRDLPAAARERIAAGIRTVLAEPAIASRLIGMGAGIIPGDGAEFAASIDEQRAKLAAVLGAKPR